MKRADAGQMRERLARLRLKQERFGLELWQVEEQNRLGRMLARMLNRPTTAIAAQAEVDARALEATEE